MYVTPYSKFKLSFFSPALFRFGCCCFNFILNLVHSTRWFIHFICKIHSKMLLVQRTHPVSHTYVYIVIVIIIICQFVFSDSNKYVTANARIAHARNYETSIWIIIIRMEWFRLFHSLCWLFDDFLDFFSLCVKLAFVVLEYNYRPNVTQFTW